MDRLKVASELVKVARELVSAKIGVGDTVKYSRNFLRSIGEYGGSLPRAKGVVTGIKNLGGLKLAVIDWDDPDVPEKVNVKNLVLVSRMHLEPM